MMLPKPTCLHIPGCLTPGEWSHHHGSLDPEDLSLYSSSVYSCHLFLISFPSVSHTVSVLYCVHLSMKCSLGISNFLEDISSLSHAIVFLYFFALITEEGFHISPCYSLELCIQIGISFLFFFRIISLLFSAICKASSNNLFSFLHLFFSGMVLITASCTVSQTSVYISSSTVSISSNPLNLFVDSIQLL